MAADGHLEMTALSRVTLASAGLSYFIARRYAERGICYDNSVRLSVTRVHCITRKLCYRKDDRAMRPIHGALKIFMTP